MKSEFSKNVFFVLFLLFGVISQTVFASSPLWGNLKQGKYEVGLSVKTYQDSANRPIEIFLWYPSKKSKKSTFLTFADYYRLSEKDLKETDLPETLAQDVTGGKQGVEKVTAEKILNSKMKASQNAPKINGRFPLVLWSSRHLTAVSQSVLSEFLASYGYVIAFAKYGGEPLPFPFQIKESEKKAEVLETHVKDLEFALSKLWQEKSINAEKLGLLSWSYGGESALKLQMKRSEIDLVIGLSSIRFDRGPYQGKFSPEAKKLNVPYVLLWETIGTNGQSEPIQTIFNDLPKESYYLEFKDLRHGNFNVLEGFIPGLFGIQNVQNWSKNDGFAQIGYETVCRFSLGYLDYFLKDSKNNLLKDESLPKDFVQIKRFN